MFILTILIEITITAAEEIAPQAEQVDPEGRRCTVIFKPTRSPSGNQFRTRRQLL
jgi:hypothetical protein